jgi:hypothetical protein
MTIPIFADGLINHARTRDQRNHPDNDGAGGASSLPT